jgi:hypothetical protein
MRSIKLTETDYDHLKRAVEEIIYIIEHDERLRDEGFYELTDDYRTWLRLIKPYAIIVRDITATV